MEKYIEYLKKTENNSILNAVSLYEKNIFDEIDLEKVVLSQDEISKRVFYKQEKIKRIL